MKKFLVIAIALLATPALAADPVPPGAKNLRHSLEDLTSFDTTLRPSEVDAFYRRELTKRGWVPGASVSYGTTLVLDLHKSPKAVGRVTITPQGPGRTHVIVGLSE